MPIIGDQAHECTRPLQSNKARATLVQLTSCAWPRSHIYECGTGGGQEAGKLTSFFFPMPLPPLPRSMSLLPRRTVERRRARATLRGRASTHTKHRERERGREKVRQEAMSPQELASEAHQAQRRQAHRKTPSARQNPRGTEVSRRQGYDDGENCQSEVRHISESQRKLASR